MRDRTIVKVMFFIFFPANEGFEDSAAMLDGVNCLMSNFPSSDEFSSVLTS